MTTLELARAVAVRARGSSTLDRAAVAVLDELHANGSWFCRSSEVNGITVETLYEQLDLFDGGSATGGGSAPAKRRGARGVSSTIPGAVGAARTGGGG